MDMIPKRNSLVAQTAQVLRDLIQAGEWDTYLSTEKQLKDRMQVGLNTIRAALEILTKEGWISEGKAGRRREIINRGGREPSKSHSKVVGLLSPSPLEHMRPVTLLTIAGLRDHLAEMGCRLEIHTSRAFQLDKPDHTLEMLVKKNPADVWILLLSTHAIQEWFSRQEFPCMVFGSVFEGIQLPCVELDLAAGTRHAVGQLIRKGHSHLGIMLPQDKYYGDKKVESAFWEALAADKNPDRQGTVVRLESNDSESVCRGVKRLMSQTDVPTALILSRIVFAHAVMSYAPQRGIRIPQDLSIISIGDSSSAQWLVPALARYKVQPDRIIGKQIRLIHKLLSAGPVDYDRVMVEPEWTVGDSVAPPGRH
jgi:DNA-binding LacI/PurR family transcriptional regulator